VVNGHVCKLLARTGFLSDVLVENTNNMIVKAREERRRIENLIKNTYPNGDFFMIDSGAFIIGITYCREKEPNCAECPLEAKGLCRKNVQIRAY